MRAWLILVAPIAAVTALCCVRIASSQPPVTNQPTTAPITLPISQLVLYSNGLGHFQREGEVDGHARIELTAHAGEMNDMLKSLVVDDHSATPAVIYDGPDASDQQLSMSAANIVGNPALGDLLHQARGESVEVVMNAGAGDITGSILGMEERLDRDAKKPDAKVDVLNLWTDSGVRSILLKDVRSVKFVNARLDAEVRRAFAHMVAHHDPARKSLRVNVTGEGRRRVGVSYVAEAPVWKATYRLMANEDGTTRLQGWALVENTTNEDWNDIKLVLAGSRPVSFQMDLYPPLFVPRPVLEPAFFAALRPPTYAGPMQNNLGFGGGIQGFLGGGGMQGGGYGFAGGTQQTNLGYGGGNVGFTGGYRSTGGNPPSHVAGATKEVDQSLTFDKYKKRMQERRSASESHDETIHSTTSVAEDAVGEPARYVVPGKVSIPRMKSALVPFFTTTVTATLVSVFTPSVHMSRALQAYRIKNNTGNPLAAGPVTVARADGYAGDARFTAWPADEERFVAYAVDLACECQRVDQFRNDEVMAVKLERGRIEETRLSRTETKYAFRHRGGPDRAVWVEHPVGSQWKLIKPAEAAERTRDGLRFKIDLAKGKTEKLDIVMELTEKSLTSLRDLSNAHLRELAALTVTAPAIKQTISEVLGLRDRITQSNERIVELQSIVKEADDEQGRLRKNLERVPAGDPVQKHLLEKLAKQEAIIDENRRLIAEAKATLKSLSDQLQIKTATAATPSNLS